MAGVLTDFIIVIFFLGFVFGVFLFGVACACSLMDKIFGVKDETKSLD
jgi:hypothetical protein